MAALHAILESVLQAKREPTKLAASRAGTADFIKRYFVLIAADGFYKGKTSCVCCRGPGRATTALNLSVYHPEHLRNNTHSGVHSSSLEFYSNASFFVQVLTAYILFFETVVQIQHLLRLFDIDPVGKITFSWQELPAFADTIEP